MKYELTSPFGFEVTVCSRCCGSGQYSYNQIDGSRCYGCGGSGKKYTKRGKAAKLFYTNSLKLMPADVVVGQRIEQMGTKFTVASVDGMVKSHSRKADDGSWEAVMCLQMTSVSGNQYLLFPTNAVTLVPQGEEKTRLIAAALVYQDSLTAAGKPRKNAASST